MPSGRSHSYSISAASLELWAALGTSDTLSGTFASPDGVTVPDGIYGYLKLVISGGLPTDPALYWTRSNAFSGGSASYSITGIAVAGTYTSYAFIDMNANALNNATAMPDSSDSYRQTGQQIAISGNQTLNLGSSGWITASPEEYWTYVGTWVNPAYNGRGGGPPGKVVLMANSVVIYESDTDTMPLAGGFGSLAISDDWTNGGAHYFKGIQVVGPSTAFFLVRVSDNNSTLRITSSPTDYPTSVDTSLDYSRQ